MNTHFNRRTLIRRLGLSAVALLCLCAGPVSADFYVSAAGTNSPTYGAGHTNLQEAIDASVADDTVWIEDGFVCDTGGRYVSSRGATNRIVIDKAITVRSVSGTKENAAVIVGAHHEPAVTINGTAAVRCLYVSAEAFVIGLQLTNGATSTVESRYGGGAYLYSSGTGTTFSNCVIVANNSDYFGGGVFSGGVFSHCSIVANYAVSRGAGVYGGTLRDCELTDNTTGSGGTGGGMYGGTAENCRFEGNFARLGGGVYSGTVSYSTLVSNSCYWAGGGSYASTLSHSRLDFNKSTGQNAGGAGASDLSDCVLTGNTAAYNGAAIYGGSALRCVITNNVNGRIGGGVIYQASVINSVIQDNRYTGGLGGIVRYGTVVNSLFTGNEAKDIWNGNLAGVVREATIYNSTIADNAQGRAAVGATLINTIAWNNWQPGSDNVATNSLIDASAVDSGEDNLDTDPLFADSGEWPYRLNGASPAIDHGIGGFDWMLPSHPDTLGLDLSGRRRVIGSAVDLGAFEFMPMGTQLIVK